MRQIFSQAIFLFLFTTVVSFVLFMTFDSNSNSPVQIISPVAYNPLESKSTGQASFSIIPQYSFGRVNDDRLNGLENKSINILLLGLDSRVGKQKSHCDAIHMITLNFKKSEILINSLPRGTTLNMPGVDTNSSYIANACSIFGLKYAAKQIESLLNITADYKITLGFSQAQGIFRTIGMPATETLKFLRSRKYKIGDYQRSHNQALFLKDMIVNHLEKFAKMPRVIQYLIYKTVDTDIEFGKASDIVNLLLATGIYKNPNRVKLTSFSPRNASDIHLIDTDNESLPLINDESFITYQKRVENYLLNLINKANNYLQNNFKEKAYAKIKTPFKQQIWHQLEDENKRNYYYFKLLKLYITTAPDRVAAKKQLLDYIYQMEALKKEAYYKKAIELINDLEF